MGKKIALGIGALLLIGSAVMLYLWRQATALPQWYEEDPTAFEVGDTESAPAEWIALDDDGEAIEEHWPEAAAEDPGSDAATPPAAEPESAAPVAPRRRKAKRHELRGFHRRRRSDPDSAVRASRAVLEGDKLEAGVILDLSRVPKDGLVERDRRLYERAVEGFPGLTRRNVYVGIEDHPVTKDGFLQLGASPKVRVGNLRYSLDKAAAKLGMSPQELRAEFDRELRRMKLRDPTRGG